MIYAIHDFVDLRPYSQHYLVIVNSIVLFSMLLPYVVLEFENNRSVMKQQLHQLHNWQDNNILISVTNSINQSVKMMMKVAENQLKNARKLNQFDELQYCCCGHVIIE